MIHVADLYPLKKVGITALSRGEIRIVQSSMVGSILSGTLLVRISPVRLCLPYYY
jgi:hypothetical protein